MADQERTALTPSASGTSPFPQQFVPAATQRLIQASVSEETLRVYTSALHTLSAWLDGRSPTDALISEYLTLRHQAGLSPSSISLIPAALQFAARLSGEESPIGVLTERTMAGIRRAGRGRGTGQVTGITFMETKFLTAQIARVGVSPFYSSRLGYRLQSVNLVGGCVRISGAG